MADKFVFKINGVDMLPYIEQGGIEVKRNDIDAEGSGRETMDATMHRSRIAIKDEMSISCMPLPQEKAEIVLNVILPEWVEVEYTHPRKGIVYETMYSNNVPATCARIQEDGTALWDGIKFPLIEK